MEGKKSDVSTCQYPLHTISRVCEWIFSYGDFQLQDMSIGNLVYLFYGSTSMLTLNLFWHLQKRRITLSMPTIVSTRSSPLACHNHGYCDIFDPNEVLDSQIAVSHFTVWSSEYCLHFAETGPTVKIVKLKIPWEMPVTAWANPEVCNRYFLEVLLQMLVTSPNTTGCLLVQFVTLKQAWYLSLCHSVKLTLDCFIQTSAPRRTPISSATLDATVVAATRRG